MCEEDLKKLEYLKEKKEEISKLKEHPQPLLHRKSRVEDLCTVIFLYGQTTFLQS